MGEYKGELKLSTESRMAVTWNSSSSHCLTQQQGLFGAIPAEFSSQVVSPCYRKKGEQEKSFLFLFFPLC